MHSDYTYYTKQLKSIDDFQTIADLFKQLGDSTRIRIFWFLCHQEECVSTLALHLGLTPSSISHHIRTLKESNLICAKRKGKEIYYMVADNEQSRLLHQMIEQVMEVTCPKHVMQTNEEELLERMHEIHDYLTEHISERITIDALARKYHMNTTTLKTSFKSVYKESLASHIIKHRMELAAELLANSSISINDIAKKVGYESQSKFTSAFKTHYQVTPTQYRKMH